MTEIIVLIEKHSPRLEFVINFIKDRLKISIHAMVCEQDYDTEQSCIDYRYTPADRHLTICNSGFFDEINEINLPKPTLRNGEVVELFPADKNTYDISFDMFAAIFFCLSRYEEYQSFTADQHGRFPSTTSHAHEHDYLDRPVVDEWIVMFRDLIVHAWGVQVPEAEPFQIFPTIDVDVAWAYLHRKRIHPIGSQFKKIVKGQEALLEEQRQAYKTGSDPFDSFGMLKDKLQEFNTHYFFLCHHAPPIDTAYFLDKVEFKNLIREQESFATVGIHPSYASSGDQVKIQQEKQWLEQVIGRTIHTSRQHYLKLSLPQTYRDLIASNIQKDFSMGYADQCGFRAGTSSPFYFYDLLSEEQTELMIHPFSMMDVTLKDYQNYSTDQAIRSILEFKQILKKVNGQFSFIWHNSSFAKLGGWEEWDRVFDVLLES